MKTKIKRMSKRTLAMLLGVLMLVTSIGLGSLITVNATTYYIWKSSNNAFNNDGGVTQYTMNGSSAPWTYSFNLAKTTNTYFRISTSNSSSTSGNIVSSDNVTFLGDNINSSEISDYDSSKLFRVNLKEAGTVTISYDGTTITVTSGDTSGGSTPTPVDPTPTTPETTTENASTQVSGKTLFVSYDTQSSKWNCAYFWDGSNHTVSMAALSTPGTPNSTLTNKVYYKDLSSSDLTGSINYILAENTSWKNQTNDRTNKFSKGSQFYAYNSNAHGENNHWPNDEQSYTPLKANTITFSNTIFTNTATTITVVPQGGIPWFYNTKSITGSPVYKLTVYSNSGRTTTVGSSVTSGYGESLSYSWTPTSSGSQTLYFRLEDGVDTVDFQKTFTVENAYTVNISAGEGGSVSPNGDQTVGTSTGLSVTATPNQGYSFTGWTKTAVTTTDDSATTTVKPTDSNVTHNLVANFSNQYTLSKGTESHGTFSLSPVAGTVTYGTPVTVTCTPHKGYSVSSVKYGNSTASGSGNTWTFNMPASDTEVNVTFTKKNNSITKVANPSGSGTVEVYSQATGSTTKANYQIGNTIYPRATPNAAYNFSKFVISYADGSETEVPVGSTTKNGSYYYYALAMDTTHFTNDNDGSITVTGYFTAKPTYDVIPKSNNKVLGTVSTNVTSAYEGQEITVTTEEQTGTFSSVAIKKMSDGSDVTSAVSYSSSTKKFTMPAYAVKVEATFTEYKVSSEDWYYNGYGSSGGVNSDTTYGTQMTEAKINGSKYAYYHVTNRSGDQLFTISYKSPKHSGSLWFTRPNSSNSGWLNNKTPYAYFLDSSYTRIQDWSQMYDQGASNSDRNFKIDVPWGARYVYIKDDTGGHQTERIDLNNGSCYYISGGSGSNCTVQGWGSAASDACNINGFHEKFDSSLYTNSFNTSGFYTHNIGEHKTDNNSAFLKPQTGLTDYYVLVLFPNQTYTINGVTKTISNENPEFIWLKELPQPEIESDVQTVDILAKNGSLRDSTFNRFTNLADTEIVADYFEYTDADGITYSSITSYNEVADKEIEITPNYSYGGSNYDKIENVPVGAKIKLRTTLSSDATKAGSFDGKAFKDTHYLKGYSFNGMTYQVHEKNDTGVYEEIWTVRAVNTTYKDSSGDVHNATTGGKTIEVTPIYYMKDNSNCKTFYIDGYDGEVQNAWGNMLSVYPYYEGLSNSANAFGGYPGQPMLFWGGKYQMEIPLTVDGTAQGATVKGLTLHNSYWDLLHRETDIRCNTRNHAQTYDYDDFYKLYKEKNPDTIIFDFKYRTSADNYNDGYDYTDYTFAGSAAKAASDASLTNGVELVTDYFGRQVDAFGTLIIDSKKSNYDTSKTQSSELLFVSTGYKDTYVGEYATIWAVYAPTTGYAAGDSANKFIGYISSSMLYLNNIDRRLQYSDGDNTASGRMSWEQFVNTYNHLKDNYKGVPVLISYEKEIWNDSKDKAYRSDGKWYYSNKSDKISSNIIIQYGAHELIEVPDHSVSSDAWTTDEFDSTKTGVGGEKNIGTTTGCSAYFTNTTPNIRGKVASGEQFADSTKKFTFEANAAGTYQFAGWVRLSNGKYYEISENEVGESDMSSNDTYIARFVVAQTGSLTIQHVVEQTDTFTGDGTAAVTVTVSDASGTQLFTDTKSDGSKIDISKYIDSRRAAYKIDISLTTTPSGESFMKEIVSSVSGKFVPSTTAWNAAYNATTSTGADTSAKTATVAQFTVQDVLNAGVSSVRYVSHLMKPKYIYQYEITYTYQSRFWGNQTYTVSDTFNDEDNFTGSKTDAKLNTDFIENSTPFEKNLKQTINWNYTDSTVDGASPMVNNTATLVSGNTYKMTAQVYSSNTVNDKVKAEFILPYSYSFNKTDGFNANSSDVYTTANGTATGDKVVIYDEKNKSTTLTAQAYKLFTYENDEGVQGGDGILASQLKLVQAAPSVVKDATYHTKQVSGKRYYTGNSFKVGDITYYKSQADVPQGATNYQVLTATDTVKVYKPEKADQPDYDGTTYHYAVQDGTDGPVYFFAYNVNENDEPVDNTGKVISDPEDYVFNGQYIVYSVSNVNDGIVQGTGTTKYFTRWDIFNSKGDLITSSYSKRFNYSGYENYIIKAVYDSSEPHNDEYNGETGTSSTISYLGDTRNQWKGSTIAASGDFHNVTGQAATTEGDKLLHDFAISYYYNGKEIKSIDSSDARIKVGMLIEKLGALDSSGSSKITDSSYYADKYKGDINDARFTKMTNAINSGKSSFNLTNSDKTKNATVNSKIGSNFDDTWGTLFTNSSGASSAMNFDSVIDNMNRLQWAYTFNNTKTNGVIGETNNANFAYRAWSYIIVGDTVTISSTPAYFTLYDSAHR